MSKDAQIDLLYQDLHTTSNAGDHEKAAKLAAKIFHLDPKDSVAFKCKIVALIKSEQYQEASKAIKNASIAFKDFNFDLEHTYTLYRLQDFDQALNLSSNQSSIPSKYIRAQVLYRMERYPESLEILRDIVSSVDKRDSDLADIAINLKAAEALVRSQNHGAVITLPTPDVDNTYELAINSAINHVLQGDKESAMKLIDIAETLCHQTFEEPEALQHELQSIKLHRAFALQVEGQISEADKLLEEIIVSKDTDQVVKAVASCNLVARRDSHSILDSIRRLRVAKAAKSQLSTAQRNVIALNESILSYYMHKYGPCQESVKRLLTTFDEPSVYGILSAAYLKQKKFAKAVNHLEEIGAKKSKSIAVFLTLVQLRLQHGDKQGALKALESLLSNLSDDQKYQAGLIGLASWLYKINGESKKATSILSDSEKYLATSSNESLSLALKRYVAAAKLHSGDYKGAASDYEHVVRQDPLNYRAIAGLVSAYAHFDPSKAENYESSLPDMPDGEEPLDVDQLESTLPGVKKRELNGGMDSTRRRTRRKRKPWYPKDYDFEHPENNKKPDPERWLPLRERTTFRMKGKKKAAMSRGPQGSTAAAEEYKIASPTITSGQPAVSKSSGGNHANKKKKKKGVNKW